jgi:polyisoprenoid-binding protein YceI
MKKLFTLSILALAVFNLMAATPTPPTKKVIDVTKSTVNWEAAKVTGKHNGTIKVKSGSLTMDGAKLTGGSFVIDMTTLEVKDLATGKGKEKLEGHLNSADFFATETHKEATFTITKVSSKGMAGEYMVSGELTIKGITKPVSFEANIAAGAAKANIKIDRTKYDIKYGSGSFFDNLGDKAIYDNFDLAINLVF